MNKAFRKAKQEMWSAGLLFTIQQTQLHTLYGVFRSQWAAWVTTSAEFCFTTRLAGLSLPAPAIWSPCSETVTWRIQEGLLLLWSEDLRSFFSFIKMKKTRHLAVFYSNTQQLKTFCPKSILFVCAHATLLYIQFLGGRVLSYFFFYKCIWDTHCLADQLALPT